MFSLVNEFKLGMEANPSSLIPASDGRFREQIISESQGFKNIYNNRMVRTASLTGRGNIVKPQHVW